MVENKTNQTLRTNSMIVGLSVASILVVFVFIMALSSVAANEVEETAVTVWTSVISDTFESGIGGTVTDLDGPTTNGEYFWATTTFTVSEGTNSAWATGGGADGSALTVGTDNYPPNAMSALTYGPVDLSSYAIVRLSYDYWVNTASSDDQLLVQASTDGTAFTSLMSHDGSMSSFQSNNISLNTYNGSNQVWIRFYFTSNGSDEDLGAFIDNMLLEAADTQEIYMPLVSLDPTPTPLPYFYYDDFSDNTSGWQEIDNRHDKDNCYRWIYTGGVYHADICDDRTDIKNSPFVDLPVGDYDLEVSARFTDRDSGWWTAYGVLFDAKNDPDPSNPDLGDYYMLWVLWEGKNQAKFKLINDIPGKQKSVFNWRDVPSAYNQGTGWNTWRIVRTENHIAIYLNGEYVTTVSESRPRTNYQTLFGVYVSTYETNHLGVEFDNYKIIALDGSLNYGSASQVADPYFVSGEFSLEALLPDNQE